MLDEDRSKEMLSYRIESNKQKKSLMENRIK